MGFPATETARHRRDQQRRLDTEGLRASSALRELIHQRREQSGRVERLDFFEWAQRVPEPKTGPLNFKKFPFQPEMYRVFGASLRDVVVRKCTQVGISALTVRWGLFSADRNGHTVLYVFPTEGDVYDFSDARVTPMIDGSEYLSGRRGEPWNKGLKRVGIGLIYFRGSENKRGLDSVDADALAMDEYDTLNQANIPDAERRLSGVTSAGLIRRVGVPSLPEYGIAQRFDESDRRKWLVQCPSCKHVGEDQETKKGLLIPEADQRAGRSRKGWQEISYWRNVDEKNARIICQWCGEPLDVAGGVWVPQEPDGELPGFHVSRLIVPNMPLKGIVRAAKSRNPTEVETFYNKDLGLPYVSKESRLAPEDIHAAQSAAESWFGGPMEMVYAYGGANPVTMGVDMASERAMTVRISEHLDESHKRALWIGETDDPDELLRLMDRYRVSMCAIDHLPETRIARALAAAFPGRVYLVAYSTEAKQSFSVNEDNRLVTVDRTVAIDATVELVRRQHNLLPVVLPDGYESQMSANVRRIRVETKKGIDGKSEAVGKVRVVWESTRADDYMHAEVYDVVATELYWRRVLIDSSQASNFQQLDSILPDYSRSNVNDPTDLEWRPGPGEEGSDSMYLP